MLRWHQVVHAWPHKTLPCLTLSRPPFAPLIPACVGGRPIITVTARCSRRRCHSLHSRTVPLSCARVWRFYEQFACMSPHLLECVHSLQSHAHRPTDSTLAKATCCHPHFVMSAKWNSHEAARIHNESINQTIGQHMKRLAPAPWSINRQRSDPPPRQTPRAAARLRTHGMKLRLHGGQRPQIAVLSRPRRHAAHNRNLRCAEALLGGAPLVPSPAVLPSRHYAAAAATGAPESAPRPPGQPTSAIPTPPRTRRCALRASHRRRQGQPAQAGRGQTEQRP